MAILYAFLIIAGIGALLGLGLAIADKKLAAEGTTNDTMMATMMGKKIFSFLLTSRS